MISASPIYASLDLGCNTLPHISHKTDLKRKWLTWEAVVRSADGVRGSEAGKEGSQWRWCLWSDFSLDHGGWVLLGNSRIQWQTSYWSSSEGEGTVRMIYLSSNTEQFLRENGTWWTGTAGASSQGCEHRQHLQDAHLSVLTWPPPCMPPPRVDLCLEDEGNCKPINIVWQQRYNKHGKHCLPPWVGFKGPSQILRALFCTPS